MVNTNPMEILLAHDQWATSNVLKACVPLTRDQFHQRFDMGPGSLHDTTTHILSAMRSWGDVLAGRQQSPRLEAAERSATELLVLLDELAADFSATARKFPLDGKVSRERNGQSHAYTRAGVITHVTTHGMHHRAQCLNMLRRLGVSPLPPSSVAEWTRTSDSGD